MSTPKIQGNNPGTELFELVQESQGNAYISDSGDNWSLEYTLQIAEASLYWTQETAKRLKGFIRRKQKKVTL